MEQKLWSISELADECGVTTRTIRFYEDKGLLQPQRAGSNRVYNYKDKARLILILRGKRLGFSLEDIGEFLALYHAECDPAHASQLQYLLDKIQAKVKLLRQQQEDLALTLQELTRIETECLSHLKLPNSEEPLTP
ncbi:MAG: MerR family DNA-binding transcriptional regulator [Gammaproteobacteria bacterium]|nr:MerR family DNA-binding transcriptional regulator [Gammaproteobacteria bacterium]MBU1723843.1 MerR family DNA-binding transcriptional regulator [Gammaproteobacteria bacterium]MBU2004517.1 MerR family DNA-binding transcriptional regulator [Gammaproteobacteria bacterium]